MEKEYLPQNIETYVQKHWEKHKTFQVIEDPKKEKYYCLPMLPYPSGKLHMGHVRNYTISDVIARYQRMLGKNVLHPMGWDAFGLPAEEAAIKNNTSPLDWTKKNIKYMKKQLQSLGFSYDWNREITTCQSDYYHWEQWFFTKLYEKKLVYKKNSLVNWCSYDKTVLANEQVIDGCCWRCQNQIEKKEILQWFIKIRNYAESLYQDLDKLTNWPENVKNMQRNWIGRKKGFEINLNIADTSKTLKVFIQRIDTIMEATCIVISFFHKLSLNLSKKNKIIKKFIEKYKNTSQERIEEIKYAAINTNMFAVHPITERKISIWIGDFSIKEYGANAVLLIPSQNEQDLNFYTVNNLKIECFSFKKNNQNDTLHDDHVSKKNKLYNSKNSNELNIKNNVEKIKNILLKKKILQEKINYKLQDWCVSRQRYWGTPIPMATLKNKKIVSIPENKLPVLLPDIQVHNNILNNKIDSQSNWSKIYIDNEIATRETDTFDTFMESSWYYARYTCPNFKKGMIDPVASKYWLPVDQYIGGIEHAIMHLMYFRFFHKLLRDFKLVPFDEPVKNLLCQGMVLSEAFYKIENKSEKKWINASFVSVKRNKKGEIIHSCDQQGSNLVYAGMIKMSKSKNNGIEPKLIIKKYGADTIRLFMMFAAPVESSLEWKESGIKGIYRFLKKLWSIIYNYVLVQDTSKKINFTVLNDKQNELLFQLNKTIYQVSDDINRRQTFNTAIAAIMKFVNQLVEAPIQEEQDKLIMRESLISIIKMLYPFTPHFCFFTWNYLNKKSCIDNQTWPIYNKDFLLKKYSTIVVQINGKKRCTINITEHLNKEKTLLNAKNQPIIKKYLKNVNIKKIIYVPKKIINFVI